MTLTEEQRAALKRVAAYMDEMYSVASPYHGCTEDANLLRAMIDSSGTVEPTGGFDLEKARAADEALPYPLDANEIWVSGKGQMHINPPNAPSIFFTLSDLCEFRNLFHGQAAEIERLRADLEQAEICIQARLDVIDQQAKEIKEREASLDEAEALTKKNAELMNVYLRRIAELEDALVEGLTNFLHYRASCYDPARRCPYAKECDDCSTWDACGHVEKFRSEARRRLQAEGKIGNGDHVVGPDQMVPCWQITEERVGLLEYCLETLLDAPDIEEIPGPGHSIEVLRAMLTEAGL